MIIFKNKQDLQFALDEEEVMNTLKFSTSVIEYGTNKHALLLLIRASRTVWSGSLKPYLKTKGKVKYIFNIIIIS